MELRTDVQIGGVDQLFNIMAGRILQRDLGQRPLVAICTPLLIGTDGHLKMSKSTGNYIGMDDEPGGHVRQGHVDPGLAHPQLLHAAHGGAGRRSCATSARLLSEGGGTAMDVKKRLAREIVALLHGTDAAGQAEAEFERVFQRREDPAESAADLPLALGAGGEAEVDITQVLARSQAVASRGEARRLLSQGAISVDGAVLSDAKVVLRGGALVRVGRHRFLRVVGESSTDSNG